MVNIAYQQKEDEECSDKKKDKQSYNQWFEDRNNHFSATNELVKGLTNLFAADEPIKCEQFKRL
jgi:uncharacterized membrane-anchored protein YhcB (DUF1043 family)